MFSLLVIIYLVFVSPFLIKVPPPISNLIGSLNLFYSSENRRVLNTFGLHFLNLLTKKDKTNLLVNPRIDLNLPRMTPFIYLVM